MKKSDYDILSTTCAAGINQDRTLMLRDECQEARNMWSNGGRIQSRPGYQCLMVLPRNYNLTTTAKTVNVRIEDNATSTPVYSTPTITGGFYELPDLDLRDRVYIGFDVIASYSGFAVTALSSGTSHRTYATCEYWNGTEWRWLRFWEHENSTGTNTGFMGNLPFLSTFDATSIHFFSFARPIDLSLTEVDGVEDQWLRFTVHGEAASLSGLCTLDSANVYLPSLGTSKGTVLDVGVIKRTGGQYFVASIADPQGWWPTAGGPFGYEFMQGMTPHQTYFHNLETNFSHLRSRFRYPLARRTQYVTLREFGETYIVQNGAVTRHWDLDNTTGFGAAAVEEEEAFVGSRAPYDRAYIAQLAAWPDTDFLTYFRGNLWSAKGQIIRWSAPAPFHKVWPALSYETLGGETEDVTAVVGYGQNPIITTPNNLYQMIDTGTNEFGLQTFRPERVVSGAGCVAHGSVQEINGRLVFLGVDEIWGYDGTPNIQPLTRSKRGAKRIAKILKRINRNYYQAATSIHWASKKYYLLAVPLDGSSSNNYVIAWDYAADAWWLWDSINVVGWILTTDDSGRETIYFSDSFGRFFVLDVGQESYDIATLVKNTPYSFLTQPFDVGAPGRRVYRRVGAAASNRTGSVTVQAEPNDNSLTGYSSGTMSFTDSNDVLWDDVVEDTSYYVVEKERERKQGIRMTADHMAVRVTSNAETSQPLDVRYVEVASYPLGRSRV
jgi:hypothetical protein